MLSFVLKKKPNLRAPVVRSSPDLCGIYRAFVLLYNFGGVEARRDARAERCLGTHKPTKRAIVLLRLIWSHALLLHPRENLQSLGGALSFSESDIREVCR